MDMDPSLDPMDHSFTPSISPGQTSEHQDRSQPITITWAMYNEIMNRLEFTQTYAENLREKYEALADRHSAVADQCITLSNLCQELSNQAQRQAQNPTTGSSKEPKIADAPNFDGSRKELLPFLTKCRLKFAGQASQFKSEKSKVLYAGARLTGPAFSWFLPLANNWDTSDPDATPPSELTSFKTFSDALTTLYGDPNLAATADREIRRLRQLTSVAEYSAKFEQHKQYLGWNDIALRDQYYTGLKDEIKDEIVRSPRPETLDELKKLATRLDSRLQERYLEKRQPSGHSQPSINSRPPPPFAKTAASTSSTTSSRTVSFASKAALPPPPSTSQGPPSTALKTPAFTADGTVPMEIGASGAWQLTVAEKQRRKRYNLCDYCGDAKHDVLNCPLRPARQAPRFNRQAVMTYEFEAQTESEPEKDHPEE